MKIRVYINIYARYGAEKRIAMAEKLRRWMYGRYGVDKLSKTMIYAALALCILSIFIFRKLFYFVSLVLIIYSYYRVFSRNIQKRYAELQRYEKWKRSIKNIPRDMSMRKTHHIYRCPGCRQKIRIPRGKGNIEITCPKCRTKFTKRS